MTSEHEARAAPFVLAALHMKGGGGWDGVTERGPIGAAGEEGRPAIAERQFNPLAGDGIGPLNLVKAAMQIS